MDQGRQLGGRDDAAELPPVPVECSAAMAEPDRLQLGKPGAAVGAAEGNRGLVDDEFTATVGKDWGHAGQASTVLLDDAGQEPFDQAAARKHGTADRCADSGERLERRWER